MNVEPPTLSPVKAPMVGVGVIDPDVQADRLTQALTQLMGTLDNLPDMAQFDPAKFKENATRWVTAWKRQLVQTMAEPDFMVQWEFPADRNVGQAVGDTAEEDASLYAGGGGFPAKCQTLTNSGSKCHLAGATGRFDGKERCAWSASWGVFGGMGMGTCNLNDDYVLGLITYLHEFVLAPNKSVPRNLPVTVLLLELVATDADNALGLELSRMFAEARLTYEDMLVAVYTYGFIKTFKDTDLNHRAVSNDVVPFLKQMLPMYLPFHIKMTLVTAFLQNTLDDQGSRWTQTRDPTWSKLSAREKVYKVIYLVYLGSAIYGMTRPSGPTMSQMLRQAEATHVPPNSFSDYLQDQDVDPTVVGRIGMQDVYSDWSKMQDQTSQDFTRGRSVYDNIVASGGTTQAPWGGGALRNRMSVAESAGKKWTGDRPWAEETSYDRFVRTLPGVNHRTQTPSLKTVKRNYRQWAMAAHPDRVGTDLSRSEIDRYTDEFVSGRRVYEDQVETIKFSKSRY